jgi:hypothetical protein
MRRFAQLTVDEQARAVQWHRDQIGVDPDLTAADATIAAKVDQIAQRRARDAYYIDPGDRLVTLPPPPPTTP